MRHIERQNDFLTKNANNRFYPKSENIGQMCIYALLNWNQEVNNYQL